VSLPEDLSLASAVLATPRLYWKDLALQIRDGRPGKDGVSWSETIEYPADLNEIAWDTVVTFFLEGSWAVNRFAGERPVAVIPYEYSIFRSAT